MSQTINNVESGLDCVSLQQLKFFSERIVSGRGGDFIDLKTHNFFVVPYLSLLLRGWIRLTNLLSIIPINDDFKTSRGIQLT